MQRSTHKILTTHVGSLPAPQGVTGEAAVRQLVEQQREAGLDIVNEGEYTKGGDWLSFTDDRFGGFMVPLVTHWLNGFKPTRSSRSFSKCGGVRGWWGSCGGGRKSRFGPN